MAVPNDLGPEQNTEDLPAKSEDFLVYLPSPALVRIVGDTKLTSESVDW